MKWSDLEGVPHLEVISPHLALEERQVSDITATFFLGPIIRILQAMNMQVCLFVGLFDLLLVKPCMLYDIFSGIFYESMGNFRLQTCTYHIQTPIYMEA